MDIVKIVEEVFLKFASAAPNVIGAIIVLLVGWLVAKIVSKTLAKILATIKIDKYADKINDTDFASKAGMKIKISTALSKLVYWVLMLVFILMATEVLGMAIISTMVADLIAYLPRLLSAIVLFILGIYLAEFIKNIVLTACKALGIPSAKVIATFVFYLVFLTLTISALAQASIDTALITSNLTVILGGIILAFAIGYGFASRDTMANFIASFYSKSKVKVGDVISIDGAKGRVVAMDSASITLQTETKIIIVPLKKLTSETIEIFTNERKIG